MKKAIKVVLVIFFTIVGFLIFSIVRLSLIRTSDLKKQNKHMIEIVKNYQSYQEQGYEKYSLDEIDETPYNETAFLASHNSYKKKGSTLGKLYVGLGDSFKEAKSLNYEYKTLTDQLQSGIFSFELDLRLRKDTFEITHVPLVDNSSTTVNFENGLKEIKYFLEYEKNSFPILLLLEIKDDYMFLDPKLRKMGQDEFLMLDQLIQNTLGNKVYKPSDMIEDYDTLMAKIENEGWPLIDELKNKVIFVIHASKYSNSYLENSNINSQVLFTSTYKDNKNPNSPFIIHNEIEVESIKGLVDQGYIVRTRIDDTNNGHESENVVKALESGAQILTSDFTIARKDLNNPFYLHNKHTIIKNKYLK